MNLEIRQQLTRTQYSNAANIMIQDVNTVPCCVVIAPCQAYESPVGLQIRRSTLCANKKQSLRKNSLSQLL